MWFVTMWTEGVTHVLTRPDGKVELHATRERAIEAGNRVLEEAPESHSSSRTTRPGIPGPSNHPSVHPCRTRFNQRSKHEWRESQGESD